MEVKRLNAGVKEYLLHSELALSTCRAILVAHISDEQRASPLIPLKDLRVMSLLCILLGIVVVMGLLFFF